jgi:heme/copper-type cytochrome/quinol oxidase subunit 1
VGWFRIVEWVLEVVEVKLLHLVPLLVLVVLLLLLVMQLEMQLEMRTPSSQSLQ